MNAAIILSGGTGTRFGAELPKQYLTIAEKPIIVYTTEQFQHSGAVDYVVVVAAAEWKSRIHEWKRQYGFTKLYAVATAGQDRQESILNGLLALRVLSPDGVIIQDAVRPLASGALIAELLNALGEAPAVIPVLPMTDTVYTSQNGQWVDGKLERSTVFAGQAPEAFRYADYLKLYLSTPPEVRSTMSGSCQLPHSAGWRVKMIPGERNNIKITYSRDLKLCEELMREKGMVI